MLATPSHPASNQATQIPSNWPIVALLLFLFAIPGIPAIVILFNVLLVTPADGGDQGFVNLLYYTTPLPIVVHAGAGILFFVTAPLQFSARLRKTQTRYHRCAGCVAILSGLGLAFSAPWLHSVVAAEDSPTRFAGLLTMSAGIVVSLVLAVKAIYHLELAKHRAWMMRGIALTLAPLTPAFMELPLFLLAGLAEPLTALIQSLVFDYDRWLGMAINLMIVEYVLFQERSVKPKHDSVHAKECDNE